MQPSSLRRNGEGAVGVKSAVVHECQDLDDGFFSLGDDGAVVGSFERQL